MPLFKLRSVSDEDEPAAGEPAEHQPQQPERLPGRRAMATLRATVVGRVAVQGDEHRQGPGPDGEGKADQDGEDDPLVAVAPGGEGVRGSERVAMPGLAEDVLAGVGEDRVVADQDHFGVGRQQGDDAPGQGTSDLVTGTKGVHGGAVHLTGAYRFG